MIDARIEIDLGGFAAVPAAKVRKAVRIATNRAAAPVKAAVVAGAAGRARFGFLAKAQRIRLRLYARTAVAVVGPSTKYVRTKGKYKRGARKGQPRRFVPANYAHLVERGTATARPHPFLRPALAATAPAFQVRVKAEVGRELVAAIAARMGTAPT